MSRKPQLEHGNKFYRKIAVIYWNSINCPRNSFFGKRHLVQLAAILVMDAGREYPERAGENPEDNIYILVFVVSCLVLVDSWFIEKSFVDDTLFALVICG